MEKLLQTIFKSLRRLINHKKNKQVKIKCIVDPDVVSQKIISLLSNDKPCMIARFGSTEMMCLNNYIGVKYEKNKIISYILGKTSPWWWEQNIINQMNQWSGFFPPTVDKIEKFCELMINDAKMVDLLGSWLPNERKFSPQLKSDFFVNLEYLNPFFSDIPWTNALKGKKVLVVHPFEKTIQSQYNKRAKLFEKEILPDFELTTIKAVQTIAGEKSKFNDWFEALEYMKNEINKQDYDICLIGAGAYGFPLAAHVKRMGKKAVHIGGSLQLFFGIRGKRWENYDSLDYAQFMNEHWVKPDESETPKNAIIVEGACYW
jgi:hypothetical protein